MQQTRKILSARVNDNGRADAPASATWLVREAMARGLCIAAVYNRTAMTLAPHIIYTRHDDPFIDAVVIEREGQPPKELKLGTFKLAGLSDIRLTAHSFKRMPVFDAADPKYEGTTISAIG